MFKTIEEVISPYINRFNFEVKIDESKAENFKVKKDFFAVVVRADEKTLMDGMVIVKNRKGKTFSVNYKSIFVKTYI